jgi:hypothetical protein
MTALQPLAEALSFHRWRSRPRITATRFFAELEVALPAESSLAEFRILLVVVPRTDLVRPIEVEGQLSWMPPSDKKTGRPRKANCSVAFRADLVGLPERYNREIPRRKYEVLVQTPESR